MINHMNRTRIYIYMYAKPNTETSRDKKYLDMDGRSLKISIFINHNKLNSDQ